MAQLSLQALAFVDLTLSNASRSQTSGADPIADIIPHHSSLGGARKGRRGASVGGNSDSAVAARAALE